MLAIKMSKIIKKILLNIWSTQVKFKLQKIWEYTARITIELKLTMEAQHVFYNGSSNILYI